MNDYGIYERNIGYWQAFGQIAEGCGKTEETQACSGGETAQDEAWRVLSSCDIVIMEASYSIVQKENEYRILMAPVNTEVLPEQIPQQVIYAYFWYLYDKPSGFGSREHAYTTWQLQ